MQWPDGSAWLTPETLEQYDRDSVGAMLMERRKQIREVWQLPGWQIHAYVEAHSTAEIIKRFGRLAYDEMAEQAELFDRLTKLRGLQKEYAEYEEDLIKVLRKHHQWGQMVKLPHFVSALAHHLPVEDIEGWLGDLQEARRELVKANMPRWRVSLQTWGRLLLLFWSLIQVKYQNLGF